MPAKIAVQYTWVYFGALAAYRGLTEEALACWLQAYHQAWKINKQPWKIRLLGFAKTGVFYGLPWYMTNTASWFIIPALTGFTYSIPEKWLRLDPHLPGSWSNPTDKHTDVSAPLFGAGFWLWLDYRETPECRSFNLKNA